MSGYVIMVDFRLKPGSLKAFRALIDENATMSCATEAGAAGSMFSSRGMEPTASCSTKSMTIVLPSRRISRRRISTQFNDASTPLVADKVVSDYNLVCEGSAVTSGD